MPTLQAAPSLDGRQLHALARQVAALTQQVAQHETVIAALRQQHEVDSAAREKLETIVAALTARAGARDAVDVELFKTIIEVSNGEWFSVPDVVMNEQVVTAMREADVDDAPHLGQVLRRLWLQPPPGVYHLQRGRRGRGGRHWRCWKIDE